MKKSLVSALTTALVVGAASTTFAAANPFSDVPADHWAYDAVAQLAAEGVVDGYGDGSFRGEQEITRYEMAQMVARAMAKGVNSAVLDKLAAEFAEELNQLGVRVAALEKKVDNVKWAGQLRYRFHHASYKNKNAAGRTDIGANKNELRFRIEPTATVNKHWVVKSRMDYTGSTKNSADVTSVNVDRMYAEGKYNVGTIQLGKFNVKTNADYGLVSDDTMTGVSFETGKVVKVKAFAGRYHLADFGKKDNSGNVWGIEVFNNRAKKFTYGVGFTQTTLGVDKNDKAQILAAGLGYKFTKSVAVEAAYARNLKDKRGAEKYSSADRTRMAFTLRYKGADKAKPGSYGIWASYLNIGVASGLSSTYRAGNSIIDTVEPDGGYRGWEFGAQVALAKNIMAQGRYVTGNKTGAGAKKLRGFFSEVNFFF